MDTGAASDAELLTAWAAGSVDAGNELIERHFGAVHRFFVRKVGADFEDLVQQTFLACIEARERFAERSSFKTFLLGIARYQLFGYYRARGRQPMDFAVTSLRDLGTSPTGSVARREDERRLFEAMQRIPLDGQIVLELAYWEGLRGHEIACVLGVPTNTVHSRLRRARESLRLQLQELTHDPTELEAALTTWQRRVKRASELEDPNPNRVHERL